MKSGLGFPKKFVWGCATSAYQIEGAASQDGRGPSVWDMFAARPGAIWQQHTAESACDHYHRYRRDVRLMKRIGIKAYRFSIAWPRVLPLGTGKVNHKGLDFYSRLVDALLDAGIAPWATLFHWDYPLALYHRGGWLNRDTAAWFADYTAVVVKKLSDRIDRWMTLNEPQCFIDMALRTGQHAPGDRLRLNEVLAAAHHTLLAHGEAVRVIRSQSRTKPRIGLALVGKIGIPARPADLKAAERYTMSVLTPDLWNNTWWTDPIFLGRYPADGLKLFHTILPEIGSRDMKTISQPIDFLGLNIYNARRVQTGAHGRPCEVPFPAGFPHTAFDWPVTPEAMKLGPEFFYRRYRTPIVITENGVALRDWPSRDGLVHDPQRIDFIHRHLDALQQAIADGVPIQGYFHWSLLDNFEWAEGYKQRFGLVYVDYPTQRRILKDSALWYRDLIAGRLRPQGR